MRPTRIRIHNFLSFESLDYNFEDGPVLLIGENLSDEGQESNGSGKTAIQSALEKCWLDYSSRKGTKDEDLIRRGEDEAVLESWIYCSMRQETLYIKRTIPRKGSNKLILQINDQDVKFATVNDGNNFIINWIGISKEDISNYYLVNKERFTSFFTSSNQKKLMALGRISNTEFLSSLEEDIKIARDGEMEKVTKLEKGISFIDGKLESYQQQLLDYSPEKLKEAKEEKIKTLQRKIDVNVSDINILRRDIERLNGDIIKKNEDVLSAKKNIESVKQSLITQNELLQKKETELQLFEKDAKNVLKVKKEKEKALDEQRDVQNEINNVLHQTRNLLSGVITCPRCGHEFILGEDIDVKETKEQLEEIEKLKKNVCEELLELEKQYADYCERIKSTEDKSREKKKEVKDCENQLDQIQNQLRKINNLIDNSTDEIDSIQKRIKKQEKEIKQLEEDNKRIRNQIHEVQDITASDKIKEINREIVKETIERKKLDSELKSVQEKISSYKSWIVRFKEFRIYLSNTAIDEIQYCCNDILEKMGSDLSISIEGFKKKADNTIKDELNILVLRDEPLLYGSFSGGERGRLEYAMILAQQTMINQSNPYGGLHFLFTDEVAEGIDSLGLKNIVKSLENFTIPILLTTHVTNQFVGAKILKVIKENNISRIEPVK